MSRHEVFGSPQHTEVNNREVRVPLNTAKFRAYRDMNRVMAAMGMGMVILFFADFVFSLYSIFFVTVLKGSWVLNGFLSLWLVVFISLASWPALLVAKSVTKTLKGNLPALVISEQGIQDNASTYVFGFIPWSEIEAVTTSSRYAPKIKKTFVGVAIVLKNKEFLLNKKPPVLRMWLGMDGEITNKHWVFIPQGRIEMPVEEVVRLANEIKEGKEL